MFEVCVFHRLKGCFCELIENRKVPFWKIPGSFWDDPCENWRVTCEGLNFVQYGALLGPECQQWLPCNHRWSRGTCLDLGTGTCKSLRLVSQMEWRNPPNFLCTISQIGAAIVSATSTEKPCSWSCPLLDTRRGG